VNYKVLIGTVFWDVTGRNSLKCWRNILPQPSGLKCIVLYLIYMVGGGDNLK
jgi:hypothetical protein